MGPRAELAALSLDEAINAALASRRWRHSRQHLSAVARASGVRVELYDGWTVTGAPPCATPADLCLGMQALGVLYLSWPSDATCAGDTYAAHEALHLLLWLDDDPGYAAHHRTPAGVWCRDSRDHACDERRAIDALDGACTVLGGVLNP